MSPKIKIKKLEGGVKNHFLNKKNEESNNNWNLPKYLTLSVQMGSRHIYDISYMCGHIRVYQERRKCGYGRMVKFLFAKEKMRVRSPLSAHGKVR